MVYCFKKLKELRLLRLFFLNYAVSLVIGGAAIAGLFLLGGGLQFYSVVILCIMYTQPTLYLLRRMDMYKVRQELRFGGYSIQEKVEIAIEVGRLKPQIDGTFSANVAYILLSVVTFFLYNYCLLNFSDCCLWVLVLIFAGIPLILSMVLLVIEYPKE